MSRRISIAVALPLFFLGSSEAKSTPANTLRELYTALGECVKVPGGLPGRKSRWSGLSVMTSREPRFLTPDY